MECQSSWKNQLNTLILPKNQAHLVEVAHLEYMWKQQKWPYQKMGKHQSFKLAITSSVDKKQRNICTVMPPANFHPIIDSTRCLISSAALRVNVIAKILWLGIPKPNHWLIGNDWKWGWAIKRNSKRNMNGWMRGKQKESCWNLDEGDERFEQWGS